MNDSSLTKQGIRNALGVVIYVAGVALLLNNAQSIFGPDEPKGPLVLTMMLLLFIVSALITGSLVLWQPAKLLVDGKKSEAGTLLCVTGGTLVICLAVLVIVLFILK